MTPPSDVLTAYWDALRATPEVVALVGGDSERIEMLDGGLADSIQNVPPRMVSPSIVVVYQGSDASGLEPEWARHKVSVLLKLGEFGKASSAWMALWDGNAAASGCRWWEFAPHPQCRPPAPPTFTRRTAIDKTEYWEFATYFGDLEP